MRQQPATAIESPTPASGASARRATCRRAPSARVDGLQRADLLDDAGEHAATLWQRAGLAAQQQVAGPTASQRRSDERQRRVGEPARPRRPSERRAARRAGAARGTRRARPRAPRAAARRPGPARPRRAATSRAAPRAAASASASVSAASGSIPGGGGGAPAGATRTTGDCPAERARRPTGREPAAPVEDHPQRLAARRRVGVARGQLRVVGERRAAADGDRVEPGAPAVHDAPALGGRDPAAAAVGAGGAPVERGGELEQHVRPAERRVHAEGRVLAARGQLSSPAASSTSTPASRRRASPRPPTLLDGSPAAHTTRAMPAAKRVRAGRLAPVVRSRARARRRPSRRDGLAAGGERVGLGVPLAGPHVPALAQHPPLAGDHAADDRVGHAVRRPRSASSSVRRRSASSAGSRHGGDERAVGLARRGLPVDGRAGHQQVRTRLVHPPDGRGPTPPSTSSAMPGRSIA